MKPASPRSAPRCSISTAGWIGWVALAVAVVCLASAVLGQIQVKQLHRALDASVKQNADVEGRLSELATQLSAANGAQSVLAARVSDLEASSKNDIDAAELADKALRSVFTIEARGPLGGSLGSAWVISADGPGSTLITNFHVVEVAWSTGITDVTVRQGDLTFPGTVTHVDQADDLALISVDTELHPLSVDKAKPRIGAPLIVIGSPYGLEGTVATGIVSAYRDGLMQFSAPVSPGDSGGPVLDSDGNVVAVTVAKVADASAEGLSFGIPVSTVCHQVIDC